MALVHTVLSDCLGCQDVVTPSGPDQLLIGAVVAVVAMAPGVLLHRFLRRRSR